MLKGPLFSIFEQWVMGNCPEKYILNIEGQLDVDPELKNYLTQFMVPHNPSFEAYDAALTAFEARVPVKLASFAFEPKVILESTQRPSMAHCWRKDPPEPVLADVKCAECGIPLRPEQARLVHGSQKVHRCDCCATMIESCGRQPGLIRAQAEYEQENARRVRDKIRMLRD